MKAVQYAFVNNTLADRRADRQEKCFETLTPIPDCLGVGASLGLRWEGSEWLSQPHELVAIEHYKVYNWCATVAEVLTNTVCFDWYLIHAVIQSL